MGFFARHDRSDLLLQPIRLPFQLRGGRIFVDLSSELTERRPAAVVPELGHFPGFLSLTGPPWFLTAWVTAGLLTQDEMVHLVKVPLEDVGRERDGLRDEQVLEYCRLVLG